ncbi:porin family protein [Proteiniphilum acetatigenes]|uniref:porin family protein n=1 Tax=Proteiniphilum acetatigenes TaxID=294710 RepID=UPI0003623044|nr:porin family protein [Proteiniphilum acetatigenes]SFK87648.1 Outer membrane protein beta-barrel domain-containing protein [Porphyromonadaceae bacterium KH3CP3RA]
MKTNKIIRTSVAIALLSILSVPLFSQIKIGVKADVGLNNPSFDSDALKVENLTSYSIGPSIEAMFLPLGIADFGIEASLLYNDNRMTISQLSGDMNAEEDVSNRYLMLPVNAKLKFGGGMLPLRWYAVAGPYAGYLISGDKVDFQDIGNDIKAKSFQAGANVGIGLELLKMIQVGVNYSVQLTDNYSLDEPNWKDPLNGKSHTWSIMGAIYF